MVNSEELRVPPAYRPQPGCKDSACPDPCGRQRSELRGTTDRHGCGGISLSSEGAPIELIDLDFEVLPAVLDPEEALEPDSPLALLSEEDNIGVHVKHGTGGADAAAAAAFAVVEETFCTQRYVCAPIEALAQWPHAKILF